MGLDLFINRVKYRQIGYFRKVNFLVAFFKEKGFDVDNQTPIKIKKEWVEDLLDRCELVLSNHSKAKELLPTMSGFFFGSTDYDEYYFSDVEEVRDYVLDVLLPQFKTLKDNEYLEFSTWY